jgi:hypothetical protein
MGYETKFEVIRTQAIESEHTSLSSNNGPAYKTEVVPQTISWWQAGKCIGAFMDVLAIALSCTFFVYAVAVKMHENMPMESPRVKLLLKLSTLVSISTSRGYPPPNQSSSNMADTGSSQGPTIYPILFAAIIGRALKSIAFWKLERGGRIGTLDRLLGSMTIVQTVLTQIQTRSLSILGLLLITIWSLSPLGGQASLRIISSAIQPTNSTRLLQYVNTTSNVLSLEYSGADTASQFVPVDVLFGAAMLGTSLSSPSSVDAWGNLKIPWIERLDPSTANAEGWYPVPQFNSSDDFTSLIGVPLSMISYVSNLTTSFNIETSYWTLSCPVFEDLGDGNNATDYPDDASEAKLVANMAPFLDPNEAAAENMTSFTPENFYVYSLDMHNTSEPLDSQVNLRPRHITYLENNNYPAHWVAANCTIKTRYVEVSTSCSLGSCVAVKIRDSREPHAPASWTSFDGVDSAFYWFGLHFADALTTGHSVTATPYQKFIIDPLNPFNESFGIPPVTVVSNATFALRLGQLFNTYWMAMLAPTAVPKGLRNSNLTADTAVVDGTLLSNATATETQDTLVLECNMVWFVVLLLSSAVTAFIGLCGLIAGLCRLGPDIGFNISSLVKDSPYVYQTSVATTLGSTDRSILMRDWYAKFGDVAAEEEVGHIAIGSGNVGDLQRGRLYR